MGVFSLFKTKADSNELPSPEVPDKTTTWVEAMHIEDPFEKEKMLSLAEKNAETIIERHFIYNQFIHLYYRQRNKWAHASRLCKEYCGRDIEIFPEFIEQYITENLNGDRDPEKFPLMPSFTRLIGIHEKNGDLQKAINVCRLAVDHQLRDGSEEGFESMLKRLEDQRQEAQSETFT
ncbi:hypothetical protein [Salicibibacter kimchii]|uniref:Tetratricopeptide repeat protein n=1 Tax=Salicibibacter kimchii TaxID=2099786 RepID=A0A345C0H1_9BACI|nr:hypothetical protein [Salicibibacter kimchii]AXF56702.1 hypothetical protein DT065_12230 [Salicibibacter kimchii]